MAMLTSRDVVELRALIARQQALYDELRVLSLGDLDHLQSKWLEITELDLAIKRLLELSEP